VKTCIPLRSERLGGCPGREAGPVSLSPSSYQVCHFV